MWSIRYRKWYEKSDSESTENFLSCTFHQIFAYLSSSGWKSGSKISNFPKNFLNSPIWKVVMLIWKFDSIFVSPPLWGLDTSIEKLTKNFSAKKFLNGPFRKVKGDHPEDLAEGCNGALATVLLCPKEIKLRSQPLDQVRDKMVWKSQYRPYLDRGSLSEGIRASHLELYKKS